MIAAGAIVTQAGCGGPLSVFDGAGVQAVRIDILARLMLYGMGAIWIAMVLLALAVMLRPRWLARLSVRSWLVWGGLVLPSAVMVPLFAWAVVETGILRSVPRDVRVIEVEAYMWGWEFTYPGAPAHPTTNLLYLPLNEPVELRVRSRDVIHSLWIPQVAGKMDAVPGHVTTLPVTAQREGLVEGQCSEFCGLGHTEMRFVVDVRGDFDAAVAGLAQGATPATIADLDRPALEAVQGAASAASDRPATPRGAILQRTVP